MCSFFRGRINPCSVHTACNLGSFTPYIANCSILFSSTVKRELLFTEDNISASAAANADFFKCVKISTPCQVAFQTLGGLDISLELQ